jgi:hypothetical protein
MTKIKAATVLLCGVGALGLAMAGLLYRTHAGAADSPQDARAREKTLLEVGEKAREEAGRQRDRAEAERSRAEEALSTQGAIGRAALYSGKQAN